MKILLLGASGLVGSEILKLLKNTDHEILIPTRRSLNIDSNNIQEEINQDIKNAAIKIDPEYKSDILICALGSTIKKAKSEENFIKIDKELPLSIIKNYSDKTQFILISALGAKSSSSIFYNKVKGELEDELILFVPH